MLAWSVGSLLLLALVAIGWVGIRGSMAFEHMNALKADAPSLLSKVAADPAAAGDSLRGLIEHSAAARELTSDPIWLLAEGTPWVGPQLNAFRVVTASTDRLLRGAVSPLIEATRQVPLETLKSPGGRLDMSVLAPLSGAAESSAAIAQSAAGAVSDIDRAPLVGRVDVAVEEADALFTRSAGALDAFSRATKLLPSMLEPGAPRTYLILVQNNAEWRSLGGISGTVIQLEWNGQSISLGQTISAAALTRLLPDAGSVLPADIESVYQSRPGRYFQNLTQIPDFTFDGPLARDMYQAATGVEADGVLSVDPVLLSYLLTATGPVTLPTGGQLDAGNAPALLMSDVYAKFSRPVDQDAYFASAASLVFGKLLSAQGSMAAMLSGLTRGVEEHRLRVWSANADEQRVIVGTPIAGDLPENDPETARVGVFLNDGTGSKMSYYLKPTVDIAWSGCPVRSEDARPDLTITLSIASDAPADAATSLRRVRHRQWTIRRAARFRLSRGQHLSAGGTRAGRGDDAGRRVLRDRHDRNAPGGDFRGASRPADAEDRHAPRAFDAHRLPRRGLGDTDSRPGTGSGRRGRLRPLLPSACGMSVRVSYVGKERTDEINVLETLPVCAGLAPKQYSEMRLYKSTALSLSFPCVRFG
ncbi:DUF4012 domain-containing protein [Microbacterium sp. SORGH_AS_0344]|uniref:DUF4012 domain-containing protein n=1 Tax=Microbacterium sp. SORGH_AS_0344 TaxID=3041767 RepID=UPI0027D79880|nr:DUF4012 domain-containing protein [Microbacterium sp. SORGH_AS_0344]